MSAESKAGLPDALTLLVNGSVIGEVSRNPAKGGNRLTFDYDPAWRSARGSIPLSLSMPLSAPSYPDEKISPWMWGLLPDNEITLGKIAAANHVSPQNVFAMLWVIGEDCPGAVQFVAPDRVQEMTMGGGIKWLSDEDIAERLADLKRSQTLGRHRNEGQFSLPGAQPKTALLFEDGKWGVPSGRIPTTHILKPPISDLDGHAENEVFCLALANKVGLSAAQAEVRSFAGELAIVVERYDRFRARNGSFLRIHQEDMCQALSVHPSRKYENEGGPGIRQIMELLTWSSFPTEDRDRFMKAIAFNFLIMGIDAHAKNYSMLFAGGGEVRLAPLYDVASYLPYREDRWQDIRMPMRIAEYYRYGEIMPRHWERLAMACRYPVDDARRRGHGPHQSARRWPRPCRPRPAGEWYRVAVRLPAEDLGAGGITQTPITVRLPSAPFIFHGCAATGIGTGPPSSGHPAGQYLGSKGISQFEPRAVAASTAEITPVTGKVQQSRDREGGLDLHPHRRRLQPGPAAKADGGSLTAPGIRLKQADSSKTGRKSRDNNPRLH